MGFGATHSNCQMVGVKLPTQTKETHLAASCPLYVEMELARRQQKNELLYWALLYGPQLTFRWPSLTIPIILQVASITFQDIDIRVDSSGL
jgi:hypothetical protein